MWVDGKCINTFPRVLSRSKCERNTKAQCTCTVEAQGKLHRNESLMYSALYQQWLDFFTHTHSSLLLKYTESIWKSYSYHHAFPLLWHTRCFMIFFTFFGGITSFSPKKNKKTQISCTFPFSVFSWILTLFGFCHPWSRILKKIY